MMTNNPTTRPESVPEEIGELKAVIEGLPEQATTRLNEGLGRWFSLTTQNGEEGDETPLQKLLTLAEQPGTYVQQTTPNTTIELENKMAIMVFKKQADDGDDKTVISFFYNDNDTLNDMIKLKIVGNNNKDGTLKVTTVETSKWERTPAAGRYVRQGTIITITDMKV